MFVFWSNNLLSYYIIFCEWVFISSAFCFCFLQKGDQIWTSKNSDHHAAAILIINNIILVNIIIHVETKSMSARISDDGWLPEREENSLRILCLQAVIGMSAGMLFTAVPPTEGLGSCTRIFLGIYGFLLSRQHHRVNERERERGWTEPKPGNWYVIRFWQRIFFFLCLPFSA